jgi:hypothetical protein
MPVSDRDVELFAARIRLHFEPDLRAVAYGLALPLARVCGARIKDLRPDTRLSEIRAWIGVDVPAEDSLLSKDVLTLLEEISFATAAVTPTLTRLYTWRAGQVLSHLLETVRGRVILRELMLRSGQTTFREWVLSRAIARRCARGPLRPPARRGSPPRVFG